MSYRFALPPQYVGRWRLGGPQGLSLYMSKRPRWLTRLLCRLLLEWEWIDGE
jgi:hypothetical protein